MLEMIFFKAALVAGVTWLGTNFAVLACARWKSKRGGIRDSPSTKEEMTMKVTWDSEKCCHSGNCVRTLPEAFFIENGTLVIKPERASDEAVMGVVAACPSKAFSADVN